MSQMCMFEPRCRQKIVVHERHRVEFEGRLIWTEPKVDFLKLCVGVLTYELVRSREQLKKAILCTMEKEMREREEVALREELELRERAPRQALQQTRRSNYENVTVQMERVKTKTSDGSTDDIFVFGVSLNRF